MRQTRMNTGENALFILTRNHDFDRIVLAGE
jgi:hypothetical protein